MRKPSGDRKRPTKQEFAVIGLGHFGASLARRLELLGHTVLGVDNDPARVQSIAEDITSAVTADATNEDALQEVDIDAFGTVVVGIDDNFEAGALITAHLRDLGIKRIICLAKSPRHCEILLRIGANQVIMSDEDSGARLAETLAMPDVQERALLDAEHSLVEMKVPASLIGQPVANLARRQITVLLIQRRDSLIPNPTLETNLEAGDTLFVVGGREQVLELAKRQ